MDGHPSQLNAHAKSQTCCPVQWTAGRTPPRLSSMVQAGLPEVNVGLTSQVTHHYAPLDSLICLESLIHLSTSQLLMNYNFKHVTVSGSSFTIYSWSTNLHLSALSHLWCMYPLRQNGFLARVSCQNSQLLLNQHLHRETTTGQSEKGRKNKIQSFLALERFQSHLTQCHKAASVGSGCRQ